MNIYVYKYPIDPIIIYILSFWDITAKNVMPHMMFHGCSMNLHLPYPLCKTKGLIWFNKV